jgi:serine/threonine protein phosphatase PrpC
VVADGMGGMSNGAEMSAVVTSAAKEYYDNYLAAFKDKEPEALLSMLNFIDKKGKQLQDDTDEDESGSTLLTVLIRENKMHFLTVGDSRIYLLREGKLLQLNKEHNIKSKMLERLAKEEIDTKKIG